MNKLSYFAMAAICGFAFASCSGDDDCDSAAPMGYYENYANNSPMEALADDSGAEQPTGDQFTDFSDNPFIKCDKESTSTFSVDADGASYAIMRKYANKGWEISPKSVRIEEFLNYFTYDYAEPTDNHTVAISTEIA
ncbi:MAG: von Willebrand factor type A domain-containing protein, partial [Bacteroidales bacterium]|nr:von Willebrand factor type A domain-containing protein [Bacteroidales bacterium]